jgi:hypothetical protein
MKINSHSDNEALFRCLKEKLLEHQALVAEHYRLVKMLKLLEEMQRTKLILKMPKYRYN